VVGNCSPAAVWSLAKRIIDWQLALSRREVPNWQAERSLEKTGPRLQLAARPRFLSGRAWYSGVIVAATSKAVHGCPNRRDPMSRRGWQNGWRGREAELTNQTRALSARTSPIRQRHLHPAELESIVLGAAAHAISKTRNACLPLGARLRATKNSLKPSALSHKTYIRQAGKNSDCRR
jgi:hypothetical protein